MGELFRGEAAGAAVSGGGKGPGKRTFGRGETAGWAWRVEYGPCVAENMSGSCL